jgi:hypothetical protein
MPANRGIRNRNPISTNRSWRILARFDFCIFCSNDFFSSLLEDMRNASARRELEVFARGAKLSHGGGSSGQRNGRCGAERVRAGFRAAGRISLMTLGNQPHTLHARQIRRLRRDSLGEKATAFQGDVSVLAELDCLYELVGHEAGQIDILFANAGGGISSVSERSLRSTSRRRCYQFERGTLYGAEGSSTHEWWRLHNYCGFYDLNRRYPGIQCLQRNQGSHS